MMEPFFGTPQMRRQKAPRGRQEPNFQGLPSPEAPDVTASLIPSLHGVPALRLVCAAATQPGALALNCIGQESLW